MSSSISNDQKCHLVGSLDKSLLTILNSFSENMEKLPKY